MASSVGDEIVDERGGVTTWWGPISSDRNNVLRGSDDGVRRHGHNRIEVPRGWGPR